MRGSVFSRFLSDQLNVRVFSSTIQRSTTTHPLRALLDRRFIEHNVERILAVGSSTQRAELRTTLESDLRHLLEISQKYKQAIIESAPISRLPPELLSLVFAHLAWIYPPVTPRNALEGADALSKPEAEEPLYVYSHWGRRGSLGWLRCTHVCRSWRSVLLSMKSLWAGIVGILPSAIPDTLERSSTQPIHLTLRETLERRIPALPWDALDGIATLKSIHVVFTLSADDTDKYIELTYLLHSEEHPMLETLDIFGNMAIHTESFQKEPSALLEAPMLRIMRLNNFFTFFSPCPLSTLSLVFNEYHDEAEPEMPLRILLKVLRGVKNTLEDLELCECFSRAAIDVAGTSALAQVSLPRLRLLRLVGRVSDMNALLGCLDVPPRCTTYYRLVDKDTEEVDMHSWTFDIFRRTLEDVKSSLPEGSRLGLRLHHAWDADDDLDIHSWRGPYADFWTATPTANMHSWAAWERVVKFRLYSPHLNLYPLTRTLFDPDGPTNGRALPQIHALRITHRPSFYMSDFELMCVSRQLPNIRLITMDAPCVMIFLNTLGSWRGIPTETALEEAAAPVFLFPHLESVWMTKGAFQYDHISCERLVSLVRARVKTAGDANAGTRGALRHLTVDAGVPFADPEKEQWAIEELRAIIELEWMV